MNIAKTGEWIRLPKFENTADFPRDDHRHVIKLTPDGDGGGGRNEQDR